MEDEEKEPDNVCSRRNVNLKIALKAQSRWRESRAVWDGPRDGYEMGMQRGMEERVRECSACTHLF